MTARSTLTALTTSAIVLVGLTACSDGTASTGPVTSGKPGAMTIQFVNPLPNYPTWKLIGDCMEKEAVKRGAEFTESGPSGQALDASAMIQQVQQAIANKKGAVITMPVSDGFAPVLKQAQSSGMVTGTLYGTPGDADINAGPDWSEIGQKLVSAVAALPGQHVLGLVAAADTGLGKSWLDGVKAAAATASNVKIAGEVYTGDDAAKALPQVNALLTAHPDVTEIVTHMGTTTPGAVAAIKSQGRKGKTFLLAGGHDNGGTEALQEGTANLVLLQNVCSLGTELVDGVMDVHEKKPAPTVPVRIQVVGKDQMQALLDQGWV
ncbi:sugar ABC transporter substrate-binding protein [Cryptosporangium sp. NPDC051539]|uniref:sugar ABC transporter substrate-binding protein n=1 Tax=Cryptosporangium sp. NPDC051539 TaxID=3363962 RepID=UPI0037BDBBFF